ncbi:taxadiene 5-alpha hydroxylase isoform X2 [Momordica charantia]|nr:taxadiene 5-alpha hydroxylase isoform X2 [Momordica charantia]XP_022147915.1 taxadiene 5-alpha hydroxylase isoform X2 [Momordica charantia]XP_022147916.1 taxadiene 5-alpha hydroxylase isoform X2 [Momordica charantia]XP_022147917.1 taxadiene 5-alpha hydroxylase isoform X2 [Momordica charantia]
MGVPWIGETMDFYRAQRNNRLFEDFVGPRVAKYGKMFKTSLMGSPTVIVNGAEANRFFLSNEFKLVVSSWPSASVQLMGKECIMQKQGETHRCLRGLIGASLASSCLEAMMPKLCTTIQFHLATTWLGHDTIALFHSAKVLTFTIVFECLLGIKVEPDVLTTFERVLEGVFAPPIRFPGSRFLRAKKARLEIEKMLRKVVREKRRKIEGKLEEEEEGGSLLSRMVMAMIRGEISEVEVIDNVVLLVFAAHDTTSFAIAMAFKMLAHHTDCYTLLLREHDDILRSKGEDQNLTMEDIKKMKYTWQVARETMRLFPPIFGSFRKAISDIEYEGFFIPKGWKVLWTTYGTHYEEEYFEDPLSFKPSRFEEPVSQYVYVPFGGGPRACAGYQLAKLNILIFIHFVVTRYNWSLIHPDEPIIMDPLPFPSHGMPIKISPKSEVCTNIQQM